MNLLFLNNNLHAAHHRHPGMAWRKLSGSYRQHRDAVLQDNGNHVYRGGCWEQTRRFLLRP